MARPKGSIGKIKLDIFSIEIFVFVSEKDRHAACLAAGADSELCDTKHSLASAHYNDTADGFRLFSLVLETKPVSLSIIVHECCHLYDMVADYLGLGTGMESTELRAYATQRLFEQTWKIVSKWEKERYV